MIFKYCVWSDPAKDEPNKALINGNGAPVNGSASPVATPVLREQPVCVGGVRLVEGLLGCCPCAFRCRRAIGVDTPATTESPVLDDDVDDGDLPRIRANGNGGLVELRIDSCDDNLLPNGDSKKLDHETDSSSNQADSGCTTTPPATRIPSLEDHQHQPALRHEPDEVRSISARSSSSSSVRSSRSSGGVDHERTKQLQQHQTTLTAHTESDESNLGLDADARSQGSSSVGLRNGAFNVLSADQRSSHGFDTVSMSDGRSSSSGAHPDRTKHHPSPVALQGRSSSSDSLSEGGLGSRSLVGRSRSALSIIGGKSLATVSEQRRMSKHSLESLLSDNRSSRSRLPLNGYPAERLHAGGDGPATSRPCSRCSSERLYDKDVADGRMSSDLPGSINEQDDSESGTSSGEDNDDEVEQEGRKSQAFETLDFRNAGERETSSATPDKLATPARSRRSDSNSSLYSGTQTMKIASPKRFIQIEDSASKDTDSDDSPPPPVRIGFGRGGRSESSDETGRDAKPQQRELDHHQMSRRGTSVGMLAASKVPPCKLRPQPGCRHHHLGPDSHKAPSKPVQQCFTHLESKDWEVTLRGLRTLSQIARDEPEQLDACAPGQLARVLGKHVKNLRSQVARVACSAAGEVFGAHIRGIEQDLDEVAGPLLHRTADTNKFLREDCNAALDIMIEHFPPHRTIMTIANRGASHQNTIVHATTARLLYVIVTEIGPEHVMILPREVRDKLLLTTAKLLTDGHLQARKHAKETFRLLSRCEGFRKALTDAVPETTLRLIDKTLKSL